MRQQGEVVPTFDSVEALQTALELRAKFEPVDLYPRDGTVQLTEVEGHLAELARVDDDELILCASGMAAVVSAVESALGQERTVAETTIAVGNQAYSQTQIYANQHLVEQGTRVILFDSGNPASIERAIDKHRPDIILAETVANGPDIPVLDIEALFRACDEYELNPTIVLDNTLPLSTAMDVTRGVESDRQLLVVESGTKSYVFNQEVAGLIYSRNPDLLDRLRGHRRVKGFGPNVAALERIAELLPKNVCEFDERNLRIFQNCGHLALAVRDALEGSQQFIVQHPVLEDHPNHDRTLDIPHGGSPVLFIQCAGATKQFELAERLWANPAVRDQAKLGQSFGFEDCRILPDSHYPTVRIAAGADIDASVFGAALQEVLAE